MFWRRTGKSKQPVYIIFGLGNPGTKYARSRHNIGWNAVDRIADKYGISFNSKKFNGMVGKGEIGGRKTLLVKPLTFMNNSGECIRKFVNFYKLDPAKDIAVIYDDIDLDPGMMRVRAKGSPGSHNGMKSVVANLKTNAFARIRIGIGKPPAQMDLIDWVLGKVPEEDKPEIDKVYDQAADVIPLLIDGELQEAMNRYNKKK